MTLSRTNTAQVSSMPEWMNQTHNRLPASPILTLDHPQTMITTPVGRINSNTNKSQRTRRLLDGSQFTSRSPSPSTIHGQEFPASPTKNVAFAVASDSATYVTPHSGRDSREHSKPPSPSPESVSNPSPPMSRSDVNDDVSISALVSLWGS